VEEGDEGGGGDEDSDEMVDIETCTPEDEFGGAAGVPVSDKKVRLSFISFCMSPYVYC
jgi:hypothetical protein